MTPTWLIATVLQATPLVATAPVALVPMCEGSDCHHAVLFEKSEATCTWAHHDANPQMASATSESAPFALHVTSRFRGEDCTDPRGGIPVEEEDIARVVAAMDRVAVSWRDHPERIELWQSTRIDPGWDLCMQRPPDLVAVHVEHQDADPGHGPDYPARPAHVDLQLEGCGRRFHALVEDDPAQAAIVLLPWFPFVCGNDLVE